MYAPGALGSAEALGFDIEEEEVVTGLGREDKEGAGDGVGRVRGPVTVVSSLAVDIRESAFGFTDAIAIDGVYKFNEIKEMGNALT